MCTLNEFCKLPKNEQVYKLFHDGKEIFTRKKTNFIIKLFSFEKLYVEVWYNSSLNIIESIKVVDEKSLFKIYEKEISIDELKNL
ncbi:MAG: hypothetical protein K9G76_00825 [Bacteroidales bacterium]|nr:hypothetical protein [Bacteroidales bacterium]MCF8402657.1 hypothetical protein [Bacteroidales bacterium]